MSTPATDAPPTIIVDVSVPGTERVMLRVTPDLAEELEELLRQSDPRIYEGRASEFSATASLVLILLAAAPSLRSLAPVLVEFMRRHNNAEIQYGDAGNIISIKGGSLKEMQAMVEYNDERRRQNDQQWNRIRGRSDPAEGAQSRPPGVEQD